MHFLIYASIATKRFSGPELVELLAQARRDNLRSEITGMLLYKEGTFLQVLEGEERTVKDLCAKIRGDSRHHKMVVLLEGPAETREFANWSMGFCNLDGPEATGLPGYSEFMNVPLIADALGSNPSTAQKLLRLFKGFNDGFPGATRGGRDKGASERLTVSGSG